MPSRKQRRRREKTRRHEYEYVYVDDEGREVAVEEVDLEPPARRDGAARDSGRKNGSRKDARPTPRRSGGSAARAVPPPSWARVGKRAAIFGPIMFVTIAFLDRQAGLATQLLITGQMLVLFMPFSYLVDRMMYRRSLRQGGGSAKSPPSRRRS
jgi:hypothetical protein